MDQESGKYQRVYADWKPSRTLEQTDVVANLQAIADAQPHDALRQHRRQRSQEQPSPIALQSIAEEDRRKSLIQKQGERDKSNERLHGMAVRPPPDPMAAIPWTESPKRRAQRSPCLTASEV